MCIVFSGCVSNKTLITDKYCNYKFYDHHLQCLNATPRIATEIRIYNNREYWLYYKKPKNTSDDQFICACISQRSYLPLRENVIMQNPDNYIDVLNDWTIKQIIIYDIDVNDLESRQGRRVRKSTWASMWAIDETTARNPTDILATTTDLNVINDFLCLFTTDYLQENSYSNYENIKTRSATYSYVRVYFEESDDIVRDSEMRLYYGNNSLDRYITIDTGRSVRRIADPISNDTVINNLPYLFEFVSSATDVKENEQINN